MSSEEDESAAPLLDTFEDVFPETPAPGNDTFTRAEEAHPQLKSALAGK